MKRIVALTLFGALVPASFAQSIVTSEPTYTSNGVKLQGYLAMPAKVRKRLPAVLIVHDWNGLDANEKGRADMIAKMGYVAFAVDIYGAGVRPQTVAECSEASGTYYRNPTLYHERLEAGLNFLKGQSSVDGNRIVAIGYCFGGAGVLEMARQNFPVLGVASFHGGLSPLSKAKGTIHPEVLVLHGGSDSMENGHVAAFKAEMNAAKAKLKFVTYPGAKHAFTVKGSEKLGLDAVGYNASADQKSWAEFKDFFLRLLKSNIKENSGATERSRGGSRG